MKNRFKYYISVWFLLLALFNVIAFVSVGWVGYEKYTTSFWIGYILITASFVIQLVISIRVFCSKTAKELFYNVPLLKNSISMLIVSLVFGGLFMLVSPLAGWIALLLHVIILVANTLKIIKTTAAITEVELVDEKVKKQTFPIKLLVVEADTLVASAKSDSVKAECKKVYEAIRYSDPMSSEMLASVEAQITVKFAELSEAVKADDTEKVAELANDVTVLVGDRNKKCMLLK